jgi:TRAP-type C4-dicarboxylate transport system permease small subunit
MIGDVRVNLKMLKKTEQVLTVIIDGTISSFFAVILLLTILQVVLRYGFNASVLGAGESMEGLFIYTTAIGAATAVRRRQHISINALVSVLPILYQRAADVLAHLLVAFLNGVMIYYSVTWISKVGGNESPVMRIPEWTMQVSIPIGCGLVIFYCFVNIVLTIRGEWPASEDRAC